MIKKMQDFLLGEEIEEQEQPDNNKTYQTPNRRMSRVETHSRLLTNNEPEAKITHHYPKKANFRFPLDVEEEPKRAVRREQPQQKYKPAGTEKPPAGRESRRRDTRGWEPPVRQTSRRETPKREAPRRQAPRRDSFAEEHPQRKMSRSEKEHKESKTVSKQDQKTEKKTLEKSKYFQGRDFEPQNIPSPVFGYEKVPLHRDYLKKRTESIIPLPEETIDEYPESRADNLYSQEEEQGTPVDFPYEKEAAASYEQLKSEALLEEAPEQAEPEKPAEVENIMEIKPENEAAEPVSINQKRESRRERRRKEAEARKALKKGNHQKKEPEGKKEPFNVLMHPSAAKRSPAKSAERVPPHPQPKHARDDFPSLQLLAMPPAVEDNSAEILEQQRNQLDSTLRNFNVDAKVVDVTKGPSVTRFEVQPSPGVKVNKVTNLTDDIKLAMAAKDLRMEAPIPGKSTIGIEVPNPESKPVFLREILRRDVFLRQESPLTVAMGLDISGAPVVADLQKMPHGLIAGATGSGKSVCINSILLSLLYKASPEELKLMLIDPKMVELASYREIPHLVTPVINDAKEATAGLKWAVAEMEDRYEKLAHEKVRDIKKYNERMDSQQRWSDKMPYVVIIIDELADLMMVSPQDVEDSICRIAQKARACGIHLLVATQRPSVDVITGLIKANIPSRTAFAVSSQADSRTILDMGGAERLIGKGDMLFYENGSPKPIRVQGTFVSDEEIDAVTDFVKSRRKPSYLFTREELVKKVDKQQSGDELFEEACRFVTEQGSASSSLLQRRFSIGYNRAAKLIDMMEAGGIISGPMGSKPRTVLMTYSEIEEKLLV
ncbi:DNA translocase FtsK [Alteribacillus sp. HJP-4]